MKKTYQTMKTEILRIKSAGLMIPSSPPVDPHMETIP